MAVNHNEANEQLRIYHNVLEKLFSCFAVSGGGRFVLQRAFSSISFESLRLFFCVSLPQQLSRISLSQETLKTLTPPKYEKIFLNAIGAKIKTTCTC